MISTFRKASAIATAIAAFATFTATTTPSAEARFLLAPMWHAPAPHFQGGGFAQGRTMTPANAWNAGATQPYTRYTNGGMAPANAWNAGATQPYMRYSNSGISPANAWNAGATQPYNRYTNSGITPANAWNAGATQPYNQYHNVLGNP